MVQGFRFSVYGLGFRGDIVRPMVRVRVRVG